MSSRRSRRDESRAPRAGRTKHASVPLQRTRIGRFAILEPLGRGGMGVVYSAYDPKLDRRVALKLLRTRASRAAPAIARKRLVREAQALARLSHPNVVPVHDVEIVEDTAVVVMEYIEGRTLRAWARMRTRTWREVVEVYCQAGRGLAAAHEVGVVHRDFKPDNALIGEDSRVRVIDFGTARDVGEHGFPDLDGDDDEAAGDEAGDEAPDEAGDAHDGANDTPARADRDEGVAEGGDEDVSSSGESPDDSPTGSGVDTGSRATPAERPRGMAEFPLERTMTEPSPDSGPRADGALTATYALMGTPAYMSPEQYESAKVGPRSDQFSFCVALYEALYQQLPFAGVKLEEIHVNAKAGRIRRPPSGGAHVPGWVHAAVCRGLAPEPADRFASMQELVAALSRQSRRARLRVAAVVAVAIAAATGGYALSQNRQAAAAECADGAGEIARVWNPARREALRAPFADRGDPFAQMAWTKVSAGLDEYAAGWAAMRDEACVAHQRGAQSARLFDRRVQCLDRIRDELDSAIAVIAESLGESLGESLRDVPAGQGEPAAGGPSAGEALAGAIDVVARLDPLARCANAVALSAEIEPPRSPELAERVDALRRRLGRIEAVEHSGRYADAFAAIEPVVAEAEDIGYPPLLAEALLVRGRIQLQPNEHTLAARLFERAALIGFAARADEVALEALARFVYARGVEAGGAEAALARAHDGEWLVGRVPGNAFVHALLLNNIGITHLARGERDLARAYFERALAVRDADRGARHPELLHISQNLALVTEDASERETLFARVLSEAEFVFGRLHPATLMHSLNYSHYIGVPARARRVLEPACDDLDHFHPQLRDQRIDCRTYLGLLHEESGDVAGAADQFAAAAELVAAELAEQMDGDTRAFKETRRWLFHGYALYYRGELDPAVAAFERSLAIGQRLPDGWWVEQFIADAHLGLGAALVQVDRAGSAARAIVELETAAQMYEKLVGLSQDVEPRHRLALARLTLARVLLRAPSRPVPVEACPRRAAALLADAERWYRAVGDGYESRLAQIARLRADHLVGCEPAPDTGVDRERAGQ